MNEIDKEWIHEKCGTNTPPKSVPKEAPKIVKRRLTTVKDLVQIITVFSCKLQGKRANKMKKVIAELEDENI